MLFLEKLESKVMKMNREILFRGKRVDNGEWVEGDFLSLRVSDKIFICDRTVWIGTLTPCKYDVIPKTVGQFTGLADKNGEKIFEGDIVIAYDLFWRCKGTFCGYIDFKDGCFYIVDNKKTYYLCRNCGIEVIGNIYDNPEMVEEYKDV